MTGHTFRNDSFSFALRDYRRVCMHTCGIPLIWGMSGLGFLMEYVTSHHLHIPFGSFWAGIRAPTNAKNSIRRFRLWTFEKKQTSHGYTWWNAPWMAPKPTPKPQTFQTEEIWNISSMEMRRLWNWILDPNGSCQGRIPWIKFKVSEPQIPKVDSFFSIGETQWPYRF